MNMKTKVFNIILALILAGALNLHAQVAAESYKYLSTKEKKANAERMIAQKYDFFEMSDEEVIAVRKELRYYGKFFKKKANSKRYPGYALVPIGIAGCIAGAAMGSTPVIIAGGVAAVGGIVLAVSGETDKFLSQDCMAKAKTLYVSSSSLPFVVELGAGQQLAMGVSTIKNMSNNSILLGPGISLKF